MNKNMQKTVLTTSAVLAGMVLGVNVNQNGVHADTTTNAATTATTDTNQQLANLKSQQTANESAVASSNAATMSAATTSANSQIADLNDQIKERQASAAAEQQNKIDQVNKDAQAATNTENSAYSSAVAKQKTANDAALKDAQAKVVTEQQKEEQKNRAKQDYQNKQDSLKQQNLKRIGDLKTSNEQNVLNLNNQIEQVRNSAKQDREQQIKKATANIDDQINKINKNIKDYQKQINEEQDKITSDSNNIKNIQTRLDNDQARLDKAKTVNKITVGDIQSYKNAFVDFFTPNVGLTANDVAFMKKMRAENKYKSNRFDENTLIDINNLTYDQKKELNIFAANLLNQVREQLGLSPVTVTKGSMKFADDVLSNYHQDNWSAFDKGHDSEGISRAAGQNGLLTGGNYYEDYYGIRGLPIKSMDDLKREAYKGIMVLVFNTVEMNHAAGLLGTNAKSIKENRSSQEYFALAQDNDVDDHFLNINYHYIKDPSKFDTTVIPLNDKKVDINTLQKNVNNDQKVLDNANNTLAQSKNTLDRTKQSLQKVQTELSTLKEKRDNTIKATINNLTLITNNKVKSLKDKINQIEKDYQTNLKNENSNYQIALANLDNKYNQQVKEIDALPTNTEALQSQLQAKLDTLKANHDAKLKQINDDANAKIATIKSQKVNDPEIDKLQAQIDQIKSDLTEKQQELDSQYQALKAKDQAEFNALAEKLKNSSSETAKGNNDHYTTDDGSATVKLPDKKNDSDKSESDNKDTNNNGKDSVIKHNDKTNGESTNTHKDVTNPTTDKNSNPTNLPEKSDESEGSVTKDKDNGVSDLNNPTSTADQNKPESDDKDVTNVNNATAGLFEKGENNVNSHNGNTVRELNNFVSRGTLTSTTAATSTSHDNGSAVDASTNAATTQEEVRQQAKLPQTGNSNSLALLALGAIASMFGFGLITKKRY